MLVMYVFKPQSTQKLTTTIAQTGPEMNIWRHGISHSCQQEYFSINTFYSTMPRPRQPVERAAFFGECTLIGLRACNNRPAYCTPAVNAPQQIRDELYTQRAITSTTRWKQCKNQLNRAMKTIGQQVGKRRRRYHIQPLQSDIWWWWWVDL